VYLQAQVDTERHVGVQAHGFSQEASFQAAPAIGPESHVRFLAIADMGQAEIDGSNEESEMIPALNTTRLMIAEADDKQLLIHNGDISYARCDLFGIASGVMTACCSDFVYAFGPWPMLIALGCCLWRLLL